MKGQIAFWLKRARTRCCLPRSIKKTPREKSTGIHLFGKNVSSDISWALENDLEFWVSRKNRSKEEDVWEVGATSHIDDLHIWIGNFDAGHVCRWGLIDGDENIFIRHFRTSSGQGGKGYGTAFVNGLIKVFKKRYPKCKRITIEGGGEAGPALQALFNKLGWNTVKILDSTHDCYQSEIR
ncbi:GNAT family N-acetyltransferase [Xanthomonas cannabis]|uniref:GNAT family N-acetyltransferase n=1 Tax=Xanthomonas cannabis TaxID=1885674 RepID=UPI001111D7A3|nr:GNAT family N-acetyltransferase [Xanthomonas cannabis]